MNGLQVECDRPCKNSKYFQEYRAKNATLCPTDDMRAGDTLQHELSCPTWTYRSKTTLDCQCGCDIDGAILCNRTLNTLSILDSHCVTYDEEHKRSVTGKCFYGCFHGSVYKSVSLNISHDRLNEIVCGQLNRKGRQCSSCKEGYFPLVYSYDLRCIRCDGITYNWVKYTAIAVLPSTCLFVLVVFLRVNALSPQLHVFVQISQAFASAINVRPLMYLSNGATLYLVKIIIIPYSIMNLDFFRSFVNDLCVDLTTLQTLALDYVTAVYPLLLVITTYICIELHAKNCKVIVWIWKPFRKFLSVNWDIHSSIVKTFATFLLLSYGKLLCVTFDLLIPTTLYNVRGEFIGFYLYYDASYEYFSHDHLPYAVLALVVTSTLLLPPPFLLLLYSTRCCKKRLNNRGLTLYIFIECFNGYYKDGTEANTRDCRWFSAIWFFFKILFVFTFFALTKNIMMYTFLIIFGTCVGILVLIVAPYKLHYSRYNTTDALLLFLFSTWCASVTCVNQAWIRSRELIYLATAVTVVISLLPLMYILILFVHWLYKNVSRKCRNKEAIRLKGVSRAFDDQCATRQESEQLLPS